MKKILILLLMSLVLPTISYAKMIDLKDCDFVEDNGSMLSDIIKKIKYLIYLLKMD